MIKEFIAEFTDKEISGIRKIGRKYFLVSEELEEASRLNDMTPDLIGIFLGEEKKGRFFSSLALLNILSETSNRKIFIDANSEWLFLCGRDIMAGSITKANVSNDFVLIQNEKDVNLGLGKIIEKLNNRPNTIVIKNVTDKGDYLRREMNH